VVSVGVVSVGVVSLGVVSLGVVPTGTVLVGAVSVGTVPAGAVPGVGAVRAGRVRDGRLLGCAPVRLALPPPVVRDGAARFADRGAWPLADTGIFVNGFPLGVGVGRRVTALEAVPAPAATVATPPRTRRVPSDTPAPAVLPPRLAPVPSADPTVRTAASAGRLTASGAFSCQNRVPYPNATPISPAINNSSIGTTPISARHHEPVSSLAATIQPHVHSAGIAWIG
jgi:hypothetical protein